MTDELWTKDEWPMDGGLKMDAWWMNDGCIDGR
jgi:hypothetical protein